MTFLFDFVSMVDYINVFLYIDSTLYPYLVVINDGFDVFLVFFCRNFIEYFFNIHTQDCSEFLLFGCVLVWFRYQSNCGFKEQVQ